MGICTGCAKKGSKNKLRERKIRLKIKRTLIQEKDDESTRDKKTGSTRNG